MRARVMSLLSTISLSVVTACGTEQPGSSQASPTPQTVPVTAVAPMSTEPGAPAATRSTLPATEVGSVPTCEQGLTPALVAYDVATGDIRWSYCSAELAWREVRGATDEVVYFDEVTQAQSAGSTVQELVAVDARTGSELWRVGPVSNRLGWPLGHFTGGGVIVVSKPDEGADAIVGVDAASGDELWRVQAAADSSATPITQVPTPTLCYPQCVSLSGDTFAPIANTDDVVVLAGSLGLGGLLGLERSTGRQLWANDVHLQDDSGVGVSRGATAVTGDTVVVPTGQTLTAVDAGTGSELWKAPRLDHPAALGEFVVGYVPNHGPVQSLKLRVLDATTGATLWTEHGTPSYGELWAIDDGAVYVLESGDVSDIVAYEIGSGEVRWRRASDPMVGRPQQSTGDLLLVRNRGALAILSTVDGTTRWLAESPRSSEGGMSSVGYNTGFVFVSFDSLPPGD